MPGEWPAKQLEEVAELSGGFAFKSEDYAPEGRFVLRTLNIKDDGSIHRDSAVFLPLEKCDLYKRFELQEHDTLFVMVGATLGKVGYVRRETLPALLNQNMWRIRGREGLCDKRYLQYAFRHTVAKNIGWASGSARDFVRRDDYRTMEIPVPSLAEQKAIAAVLGALDDKIQLNRRMNATLEAMARALFQSWFVDATAAGLPKGWRVVTVADTCENIFSGGTPSTKAAHYWGGNIPWLTSGETRSHFIIETEKTITKAGVENSSTRLARAGCTVIAGAGQGHTRGQTSLLTFESYINQSVVALAANLKVSSDLFLFFDLARRYEEFRQLSDSHSSRGSLTTKMLAGVKCVLPPHEIIAAFDKTVGPVIAQITANLHQSRTLATLRDTLLPKLLSGELSVAALESKREAAR